MRTLIAAAVLGLAILTGCSTTPAAVSSSGGAAAAPAAAANGNIVQVPFGGSFNGDVILIGLSKPAPYTPSDSAFITQNTGRYVAFNLTIGNKTTNQQLGAMSLILQATSGNVQDQEIQDSANNVGDSTATILPGKTLTWEVAFSVPVGAHDITVQEASIAGGKTIVFAGSI